MSTGILSELNPQGIFCLYSTDTVTVEDNPPRVPERNKKWDSGCVDDLCTQLFVVSVLEESLVHPCAHRNHRPLCRMKLWQNKKFTYIYKLRWDILQNDIFTKLKVQWPVLMNWKCSGWNLTLTNSCTWHHRLPKRTEDTHLYETLKALFVSVIRPLYIL